MRGKLLFFLVFAMSTLFAQTDSLQTDTLKRKPLHHAFFIQPEGYGAYVFDRASMISGAGINWLINHKIYIGVRYNILSTPVNVVKLLPLIDKSGNVGASSQSASLNIGYIAYWNKRFSFNPEISVGWADAKFTDPSVNQRKVLNYAIVIPSLNGVWNAHKNFRVGASIGARAVFGENYYRIKSYRVGGIFGGIFLRVGKF